MIIRYPINFYTHFIFIFLFTNIKNYFFNNYITSKKCHVRWRCEKIISKNTSSLYIMVDEISVHPSDCYLPLQGEKKSHSNCEQLY